MKIFEKDINQLKKEKLEQLQQQTYKVITSVLPEWKQNSWNKFIDLYEKQRDGKSLQTSELDYINEMTDNGAQTSSTVYLRCQAGLKWITDCKIVHKQKEKEIKEALSSSKVRSITIHDIEYPDSGKYFD